MRFRTSTISFDSLWRWITFLMIITAFFGLFMTGELNPFVSIAFVALWAVALLFPPKPKWWPRWIVNVLLLFAIYGLARLYRPVGFNAVIYFVLLLVIVKSFGLRTPSDYLGTQVLCFFMILSTAAMTVSFFFAPVFLLWLFLATVGMGLYGIAIGQQRTQRGSGVAAERSPETHPRFPVRFLGWGGIMSIAMLAATAAVFAAMPHYAAQNLNAPLNNRRMDESMTTGFSENVDLGAFKSITPDPRVVMRVEPQGQPGAERKLPAYLRMRGLALDHIRNNRWETRRRGQGSFGRNDRLRELEPNIVTAQQGQLLIQRVYQNPDLTLRIFGASYPIKFNLLRDYAMEFDQKTAAARISLYGGVRDAAYQNPLIYEVTSRNVDEATAILHDYIDGEKSRARKIRETLRQWHETEFRGQYWEDAEQDWGEGPEIRRINPLEGLSSSERMINTSLSEVTYLDRIAELSRRAAPGPTEAEIMVQATRYLQSQYQYTLSPELPEGVDAIQSFLFDTKRGHCEFFATALVFMLRARGIPARIVNGFYSSEWNDLAGLYIVRQSDAHSWVEAWHDELGWLTLDPTPPGSLGRGAYGENMGTEWSTAVAEYVRVMWQRMVIDYSGQAKVALIDRIEGVMSSSHLFRPVSKMMARMRGEEERSEAKADDAAKNSKLGWLIDILAMLAVVMVTYVIWRLRRRRRLRARRSPVEYFDRLLRKAERAGRKRSPHVSPAEFAAELRGNLEDVASLDYLLGLYHRQRFGGYSPTSEELGRARQIVESLQFRVPLKPLNPVS